MSSRTWGQKVGSTWILNAFPIKVQILKSFTNFLEKTTDKVTNLGPALQFLRFSNYFSHSVGNKKITEVWTINVLCFKHEAKCMIFSIRGKNVGRLNKDNTYPGHPDFQQIFKRHLQLCRLEMAPLLNKYY